MISIIIPVFNKPENLEQCLTSVFKQTYRDVEVIVVDDGSSDSDVIKNIISKFPIDEFVRQDNQGAPKARNVGFDKSKGEYIIFLDSDAVMSPNMLEKMYNIISISDDLAFVYSSYKYGSHLMTVQDFDIESLQNINYIHTSSLLRRKNFPKFDESLKKFQDWDLWLTITEQGGRGQAITEVLFKVIDTSGTMSTWLPSFVYSLHWPILGYTPKVLQKYFKARDIIRKKHNL